MISLFRRKRIDTALRTASSLLIAGAVLILGYCGFLLVDAAVFQARQGTHLDRLIRLERARGEDESPAHPRAVVNRADLAPASLFGRIEIPRLSISAVIVEGCDETTLRRSIGHIPGTSWPGQSGNVGLAGHRDTFFRPLRNIRPADFIRLRTSHGDYSYRVVSTEVVKPSDVAVLRSTGAEVLTLVTCHPFYFIGSAPDRFIVRAERFEPGRGQVVTR